MPLRAWEPHAPAGGGGKRLVGTVIKFPDEGRIVRFGRDADESATIIILPVIRIERYADAYGDGLEPQTQPPADNGGPPPARTAARTCAPCPCAPPFPAAIDIFCRARGR